MLTLWSFQLVMLQFYSWILRNYFLGHFGDFWTLWGFTSPQSVQKANHQSVQSLKHFPYSGMSHQLSCSTHGLPGPLFFHGVHVTGLWNRLFLGQSREIRFSPVKFRFSVPERSDLRYNSLRASIHSTWRTDVLGFNQPNHQNQAASARETLYPIACNHETGEIYSGKPGIPYYDVREIASIKNRIKLQYNQIHFIICCTYFWVLLHLVIIC